MVLFMNSQTFRICCCHSTFQESFPKIKHMILNTLFRATAGCITMQVSDSKILHDSHHTGCPCCIAVTISLLRGTTDMIQVS